MSPGFVPLLVAVLVVLSPSTLLLEVTAEDNDVFNENLSGAEILRMLGLGEEQRPHEGRTLDVQTGAVQVTKYTRCELAEALRKADIPEEQIPIWLCLANRKAKLDISAVSRTKDASYYGLFQVSDQWWCNVGARRGCGVPCSVIQESLDATIQCAKMVYAETRIQKGDGFQAWDNKGPHPCRNATASDADCPA